jgi:putative iron-regulated protein
LTVPYETKDQENEHSCFSDTTHTDVVYDSIGIKNVLLGSYQRTDGSVLKGRSIRDLVRISDPDLALALERAITDSERAARAIPPPFDRAIQGTDDAPGRVALKRAIVSFQKLTTTLDAVAAKLGLSAAQAVSK